MRDGCPWCRCLLFCFFCFQAEDGIRGLVRSRGLGDVYKRQELGDAALRRERWKRFDHSAVFDDELVAEMVSAGAVSYTHLTLPTSDLV